MFPAGRRFVRVGWAEFYCFSSHRPMIALNVLRQKMINDFLLDSGSEEAVPL